MIRPEDLAPSKVQPAPVPTEFGAGRVSLPSGPAVILQVSTPCGLQVYFLDLDTARKVGAVLTDLAGGIVPATVLPREVIP